MRKFCSRIRFVKGKIRVGVKQTYRMLRRFMIDAPTFDIYLCFQTSTCFYAHGPWFPLVVRPDNAEFGYLVLALPLITTPETLARVYVSEFSSHGCRFPSLVRCTLGPVGYAYFHRTSGLHMQH